MDMVITECVSGESVPVRIKYELKPGALFPMGKPGIWWRVLSVSRESSRALLIAERPVCKRAFNEFDSGIKWENSDIRAWLNGKFYEESFSPLEKASILECTIENSDSENGYIFPVEDTKDRLFLLSIWEADNWFDENEKRKTNIAWWLRSTDNDEEISCASFVDRDGDIVGVGEYCDEELGIRPAFWLDLSAYCSDRDATQ